MFNHQEHEDPELGKERVDILSLVWKRILVHGSRAKSGSSKLRPPHCCAQNLRYRADVNVTSSRSFCIRSKVHLYFAEWTWFYSCHYCCSRIYPWYFLCFAKTPYFFASRMGEGGGGIVVVLIAFTEYLLCAGHCSKWWCTCYCI